MNPFTMYSFYTVKTDKGICFYECSNLTELWAMTRQDNVKILEILDVERNSKDIINFVVFGRKG